MLPNAVGCLLGFVIFSREEVAELLAPDRSGSLASDFAGSLGERRGLRAFKRRGDV